MSKQCKKCCEIKEYKFFQKRTDSKDGYRNECKSCQSKYMEKWKKENRDYWLKLNREYNLVNKEKRAKYNAENRDKDNEYQRYRRRTDVNYRLRKNLHIRMWGAFKGVSKSTSTLELIGCTVDELREHIKKQFDENMTWDNYGHSGWVIDHIRPCASFDLTDPEQQRQCFHYSNLHPLWAHDNSVKSDKWHKEEAI